jgi:hypothetical protein
LAEVTRDDEVVWMAVAISSCLPQCPPSGMLGAMRNRSLLAAMASLVGTFGMPSALAAPRHAICGDLGPTLGVGIPSYSASIDWPATAAQQYGVDWKFLCLYVNPTSDPPEDVRSWLRGKAESARSLDAIPVYTFYQLLQLGQSAGMFGSEPEIVQRALQDPAIMRKYFDNFVFLLQTLETEPPPVIIHVEPDSWGFMIWAMGVEGNDDATTVPVRVGSSGHPDTAGFADHAGGLGQALMHLRDVHGPDVRLGWHASNFRVGTRPEATTGFYASIGEWDVLFTDSMHLEADENKWWDAWDTGRLATNLNWISTVSQFARLPIFIWQAPIGTTDWHLFESQPEVLRQLAATGLGGVMFDLRGNGNPDDYRSFESASLATVPPSGSKAGGTAADMRARLATYAQHPLAWPSGSPCADGSDTARAGSGSYQPPVGDPVVDGTAGTGAMSTAGSPNSGCGCRAAEGSVGSPSWCGTWAGLMLLRWRCGRNRARA